MGCNFIFCIHNHQPIGNFQHVFEWGFRDCYARSMRVFREYPEFRFAVHHSGPLFEWIEANAPSYLDDLASMVGRGQVEIIGGGFYEPIFSVISEDDIHGQIGLMQEYCKKRFGAAPKGFWTAERVWDPEIPRLVSPFGLEYTILDDNHFRYAGIEEEGLYGYYQTERLRHPLKVYPIDKYLRYSIPFHLPGETIRYFREKTERYGECAFVYGDDGEKFGMWPGTFKWVYEEKWLENFIEAVLKEGWIRMTHPSEFISTNGPLGRVYLTQGSYYELSEWALPSPVAARLVNIHKELKDQGREGDYYPFIKGGVWNNFLNKYPESNALNKRTLLVSAEIEEHASKKGADIAEARRELYRSECNCAYWHGLFGGIYLSSLRHALHEHLLGAEEILSKAEGWKGANVVHEDLWNEGTAQVLVRTGEISALITPEHGGMLAEFGVYGKRFNILNMVARRHEAYHETLKAIDDERISEEEVKSIHDMVLVKEKGLKNLLVYDTSRRYSFKDLFFKEMPDVEGLMYGRSSHVDCGLLPYACSVKKDRGGVGVELNREAETPSGRCAVHKRMHVPNKGQSVKADYTIEGGTGGVIGVEININLLGGHDDDRYYEIPGVASPDAWLDGAGVVRGLRSLALVDLYAGMRISLSSTLEADVVRYPVYTVSQSDRGFEKNYQGSSIVWCVRLSGAETAFSLEMSVEDAGA